MFARYYMEQVQDGKIKIKTAHYPTFLYDEAVDYDPNEIDKGLCRGHFLLRVSRGFLTVKQIKKSFPFQLYRHIFTGPSSAVQKVRKASKRSKAQIHGMTEVTGRTIAYACVQVSVLAIMLALRLNAVIRDALRSALVNTG
jgi:hypothetical protein